MNSILAALVGSEGGPHHHLTTTERVTMTPSKVRPEVVEVLMDISFDEEANKFTRHDGSPLTAEEMNLFGQATRDEVEAARALLETQLNFHATQADAMKQVNDLTGPYFAKLPTDATLDEVMATMPAGERAEVQRLMEQVAPGGFVIRGGGA